MAANLSPAIWPRVGLRGVVVGLTSSEVPVGVAADAVTAGEVASAPQRLPLVVDMDSFLVGADLKAQARIFDLESTVARMSRAFRGEASGFSPEAIAAYARRGVDVSHLPLQGDLVDYMIACLETGREVHLITSAGQEIAEAVAARIGGLGSATGSTTLRAMTNVEKLALVRGRFPGGFVYAGRVPELIAAAQAVVVGERDRAISRAVLQRGGNVEARIRAPGAGIRTWLKAAHVERWARHALVLVPLMIAGAKIGAGTWLNGLAALLLVTMSAAGMYLLAGLLDIEVDRRNPVRRNGPLARGDIAPVTALGIAAGLVIGSLAVAPLLGAAVFACLAGFLAIGMVRAIYRGIADSADIVMRAMMSVLLLGIGAAVVAHSMSAMLFGGGLLLVLSLEIAERHSAAVKFGAARRLGASPVGGMAKAGMACAVAGFATLAATIAGSGIPADAYQRSGWQAVCLLALVVCFARVWRVAMRGRLHGDVYDFAARDLMCLACLCGAVLASLRGI